MDSTRIAVFGATGQAGRLITQLLLKDPSLEVVACARTAAKLDQLREDLANSPGTLSTATVDAKSESAVGRVADAVDLVVGATSEQSDAFGLASVAIGCGASYFGLYMSASGKWNRLRAMEDTSLDRGLTIVDDGGAHPGLPGAMIRRVQQDVELQSGWVGAKFSLDWASLEFSPETIADFASEISSVSPSLLLDGAWVRGYRFARPFDFGGARRKETCIPMCMEEIQELGNGGLLESTGFFIAGFGPLVDYGFLPLTMALNRLNRSVAGKVFLWSLRRFASGEPSAILVFDGEPASGESSVRMSVSHKDPYVLTAAPAVATIRQMLEHPKPGVYTQAAFVEPKRFFKDLAKMGIEIEGPRSTPRP